MLLKTKFVFGSSWHHLASLPQVISATVLARVAIIGTIFFIDNIGWQPKYLQFSGIWQNHLFRKKLSQFYMFKFWLKTKQISKLIVHSIYTYMPWYVFLGTYYSLYHEQTANKMSEDGQYEFDWKGVELPEE